MSQLYAIKSSAAAPVTLSDVKLYLKMPSSVTVDDVLIQEFIDACTEYGETYTRRSFRVQTYTLLIDAFADCINLRRNPIDAITYVKYLVNDVQVTVSSSVYYLKKLNQIGQILLKDGQAWPTDIDNIQQGIEIEFTTLAFAKKANSIAVALKRHVSHLYFNRGDCDISRAAEKSTADSMYDNFRIARV